MARSLDTPFRQAHPIHAIGLLGAALILIAQTGLGLAGNTKRPPAETPEQGITDQSKTIAKNPRNTKAYLRRAGYYLALAQTDPREPHLRAAADDLAAAARLAPKDPAIHRRLADVASQLREYQLAVSEYGAAIRLAPRNADYYLGRGLAYLALRKDRRAKVDFKRALALKPALRERLAVEERRVRLTHMTQDAELRLNQPTPIGGHWEGGGPDLACTGTIPIHLAAQCHNPRAETKLP